MTHGFLIGLGIGFATAWVSYWRLSRFFARIGFSKKAIWRDVFSRATYDGLVEMREHLDEEIGRRSAPRTQT